MILELRVACPVCRAHPGEDCHGVDHRAAPALDGGLHEARSRVARRTCSPLPRQ